MTKAVKVNYMFDSDGEYLEIWKVVGEKKYYGRRNYPKDRKSWCVIHDAPYGYCEISHDCDEDKVFVVCDPKGKRLFESRNGDDSSQFPSYDEACKAALKSVKDKVPDLRNDGMRGWLREYLTEEVRQLILNTDPYPVCIEDNFTDNWRDVVKTEEISSFTWLGREYGIFKTLMKSRYSEARWHKYEMMLKNNKSGAYQYCGWSPA